MIRRAIAIAVLALGSIACAQEEPDVLVDEGGGQERPEPAPRPSENCLQQWQSRGQYEEPIIDRGFASNKARWIDKCRNGGFAGEEFLRDALEQARGKRTGRLMADQGSPSVADTAANRKALRALSAEAA